MLRCRNPQVTGIACVMALMLSALVFYAIPASFAFASFERYAPAGCVVLSYFVAPVQCGAGASGGLTTTTSGCAVVAWALGTTRARQGLAALLDERPGRRSYATSCLEPRGAICIAAHSRVHPHHTTPHHAPTFGGAPAASAACHPPSALGMALGAMTVAVGLADGSVALFHVHLNAEPSSESPANSPQLVATRACSLSLGAWGYDRSATGGVSCLAACKCSPRRPHPTGTIYTPQAA